jgi:hypothetical protein
LRQPGGCGLEMPARARMVAATGDAGAGTDVLKSAWFSGPEKGRFGVAEFSTRSVSAGSQMAVPGLSTGSVGGLRCVALLRAACCLRR